MSKHRRPTKLQQFAQLSRANASPLHLGVAAGVAGTLSITGTVVAQAAPTDAAKRLSTKPVAEQTVVAGDLSNSQNVLALKDAVTDAQRERAERIAEAKARAEAKRKRLAAKRAAERREARQQAAEARTVQTASRSVERMSASAANVLSIARQVASGAYYAYGGAGPTGFDCSGFTSYVFSKVGVSLPHSSSAQYSVTTRVSSPQPGDLVFVYNGGGGSIGHVAIYAGNGYWWEASNPSTGVGLHRAWSTSVSYGRVL
ncbi:MAG TPA: C40 family peptidase [Actinomycetes bacterium]|nr:C40 family peptidase [Actinomycetes bacterium]